MSKETDRERQLREALEGMCYQFAFWRAGSLWHGGLSALEDAFDVLGWGDLHPAPELQCDEPGCQEKATWGWPAPKTETHPKGYRRTCYEDYQKEKI